MPRDQNRRHLELLLDAEGCLIKERRVAVKASLSLGLNAAPYVKGSVKASGSASLHQAACAQELISGDGRLSGTSMLFNRRHSAASSSLVLSGIAKVEAPVCWFEMLNHRPPFSRRLHWQSKARGGAVRQWQTQF
jgi:hypothetical protein